MSRVASRVGRALYRVVGRAVPLDVTRVLVRPAGTGPASSGPAFGTECRELDAPTIAGAVADGFLDVDGGLIDAVGAGGARCFAALDAGGRPVGHDFLATGDVPARWNAGGRRLRGIGLALPPDVAYLFKAWVAPAHRGRGVHGALLRHALGALDAEGCVAVVTTADWTNAASLAGFARAGFERRGVAAEAVIGGRHLHRVPAPFEIAPGRRVRMIGGQPRFVATSCT